MQIQATDRTIGFILEPVEAQSILNRLDRVQGTAVGADEFEEALREFVDGPMEDDIREDPCSDPRPDPRTHPEYWTE